MSDMMENKINEQELQEVTGGVGAARVSVKPITPIWVTPQTVSGTDF